MNFGPAVVEAFYQQIPLLVFTADRPPEWIDQQDNQAIHQHGSTRRTCAISHPAARRPRRRALACRAAMGQALDAAAGLTPGPVHINVPYASRSTRRRAIARFSALRRASPA
jgi:2-succinyl-5-enolpyruvyl-6-hydroxy-3-cyclohexene-1-carboxylate synthase